MCRASAYHGASPETCSWSVVRISSPACQGMPAATSVRPWLAFWVSASSPTVAPSKRASASLAATISATPASITSGAAGPSTASRIHNARARALTRAGSGPDVPVFR